jgi:heme-degrading monooxygenase HmoA
VLLKWIRCSPKADTAAAYLAEQRAWNRITCGREQPPSYIMAGGPADVLLLIEWDDQAAVDRFMAGTHAELMARHPLNGYLAGYAVSYFEHAGDVGFAPDWDRIRPGSAMLRHTLSRVPEARHDEFMALQQSVWSPGVAEVPGYLGGRIWRRREDPAEVLFTNYFESNAALRAYRAQEFPPLRLRGARSLHLSTALATREYPVLDRYARLALPK